MPTGFRKEDTAAAAADGFFFTACFCCFLWAALTLEVRNGSAPRSMSLYSVVSVASTASARSIPPLLDRLTSWAPLPSTSVSSSIPWPSSCLFLAYFIHLSSTKPGVLSTKPLPDVLPDGHHARFILAGAILVVGVAYFLGPVAPPGEGATDFMRWGFLLPVSTGVRKTFFLRCCSSSVKL